MVVFGLCDSITPKQDNRAVHTQAVGPYLIFTFKHFHVDLYVSYGKLFHEVKQAHSLLFHNYCLILQDLFVFSSLSIRLSNSKTATTTFCFTSILALIFRTNNQQRQQQQNVVRQVYPSKFRVTETCENIFSVCAATW